MKHKSTKNVNNNVIKKVCVLFFMLNIILAQDKIELRQADSLSSIWSSCNNDIVKLYDNVKIEDGNKTIFCDSLFFDTEKDKIELLGRVSMNNGNQIITSTKGRLDNKNEKITLLSNSTVEDKNQKIEGDLIEIIFDKSEIISLEVLENGSIFSKNFGYEKDNNNQNQSIENQDILTGNIISISMKDNQVDEIELKGMASSFIHLYEDSLYQGTNEISGDEIVLQLKNNNATELVSNGGVIGKFVPSSSNSSGQEKVDYSGDRVEFDTNSRSSKMYGNANIVQVGMDLTAAQINLDWKSNILEAFSTNAFNEDEDLEPTLIENGREPVSGKSMVYNIKNRKGKVIAGKTKVQNNTYIGISNKIILKPLNIVVGGVPIFGIPKAIFPHSNEERRSGWIMPSFGSSDNRGNYLDGLGYYFAPNDYFGSENSIIFADRQGLILKSKNQYKNRYKFSGGFNFEIRKHLSSSEQDIAKLNENNKTDFSLNWNHNQILRNDQTLRSNVSYYSNGEYNRETSIDPIKRLNQQAISNATYSKRWKDKNISMSVNVSNKQDLMSKNKVNSSSSFYQNPTSLSSSITENTSTLPSLNFRVGRRNLFRNLNESFLNNIQWDFNSRILNNSKNYYRSQELIDEEGVSSFQWEQDDDGNAIAFNQSDMMLKKNRTTSNLALSMSTKVYGILPFKVGNFQAIRHVMTPRIGFSYSPNYLKNDNYFQEFNDEYYDYFSGTLIGSTPRTSSKKINLSLGNVFQAKRSINNEEEKIDLFSLRMNTGYDVNKEEFKLSTLNSSLRSSLKNGTNIDMNFTHDFYEFNEEESIRINKLRSIPRLTGIRLSTNFTLKGKKNDIQNDNELSEETKNFLNDFSSNVWQSRIGVSYTLNKINPENKIENFWLNSNTSINVTNNWKLNYNARFNLIDNSIVRHNLTLYREIDCWELFVDWTPNGYARGLYFRLNLKSDMLQDLKVEQKTGIYTTRPSF